MGWVVAQGFHSGRCFNKVQCEQTALSCILTKKVLMGELCLGGGTRRQKPVNSSMFRSGHLGLYRNGFMPRQNESWTSGLTT